ncbi:hypothetical protein BDD43_5873 [Mucilaginibacter gracilis]|uniref:Heavy-metal resistance protein n=1 Tax=Mucilaginibacter gracilis TaxID=423350 RepID=A0A495JB65_9SPHI|nr:Spy/CpxP family protein refolding chaperone [Mucilaginibacter gracilis]RKR85602.1 hypothetical protein BDD43_5873 [Mucilaginibacter gracilis]
MKNYKIWLVIVIGLLLVNSVVLALMWFHKRIPVLSAKLQNKPQQYLEPKDVLINTLAFTPKQATLFEAMRSKHRQLVNNLNQQNHQLRDSLFSIIKKPKADTALINNMAKKLGDNQSQIEKVTLYHFRDLRAILTPAQQVKFDGVIAQVLQMMGTPGRPPGGPPINDARGNAPTGAEKRGSQHQPPQNNMRTGPNGQNHHHMGPPPDGMPPPPDKDGHRPPPPGPDDGPPPNGPPPDGHPPL